MMIFLKKFQETYNSRLRERYGDDPSSHLDFDPDLWMEVGSSSGPDKNRVYGLSNTTAENLWAGRSVLTIGSSPSVSSIQSEEFMALKQQYEWLLMDYETGHIKSTLTRFNLKLSQVMGLHNESSMSFKIY